MSGKFQPINRDTAYLLPPSLQDWLPEKHLAQLVVDIVDQLDLSELVKRYGGGGKQPYHPAMLLATAQKKASDTGISDRNSVRKSCSQPSVEQVFLALQDVSDRRHTLHKNLHMQPKTNAQWHSCSPISSRGRHTEVPLWGAAAALGTVGA